MGGLKSRVLPALVVMAVAQPVGMLLLGIAVAARGEAPPGPEVAWAAVAGLLGCVGLYAFYRGLATGSMSIIAPIVGTAAVIPVVYGLARGDETSPVQQAGFVAAILGVVLSSWERGSIGRRVAAGTGVALVATVVFGIYFIVMHEASQDDVLWPAFIFRSTFAVLAWTAVLVFTPRFAGTRAHLLPIVTIGILDTAGAVLFAAAAGRGLVSVVSVLGSLYPVVTVILARFVLGERVERLQEVGIVLAFAGIVMVSAG
jgi:drug/metabolite transporter (DMT)-like permease